MGPNEFRLSVWTIQVIGRTDGVLELELAEAFDLHIMVIDCVFVFISIFLVVERQNVTLQVVSIPEQVCDIWFDLRVSVSEMMIVREKGASLPPLEEYIISGSGISVYGSEHEKRRTVSKRDC